MTVIGLCIGGGQIELAIIVTAVAVAALWALQWIEARLRRERRASLRIKLHGTELNEDSVRQMLGASGLKIVGMHTTISKAGAERDMTFDLVNLVGQMKITVRKYLRKLQSVRTSYNWNGNESRLSALFRFAQSATTYSTGI